MIVMLDTPVVEEILVIDLTDYFYNLLRWDLIYPKHYIRFGNEYPWVPYISEDSGNVDLSEAQEALFPSVTVLSNSDSKSPNDIFVNIEAVGLTQTDWNDQKADILSRPDDYMISQEAIAEIDAYFAGGATALYGTFMKYQRRDNVTFDIVTDGYTDIKNRIYDALSTYLEMQKKVELYKSRGINIIESSVSGSRSGEYNVEFGRTLHGCSINFQVDYVTSSTFFDLDAETINDVAITHNVEVR